MRLMIVHEDPLYQECLAATLTATGRFGGVGLAADAGQAWAAVEQEAPDLLLVQWDLPMRSALDLVCQVAASFPTIPVVLFGLPDTCEAVRDCAEAGAANYILKGESLDRMLERIADAARGETACSPKTARFLFAHLAELSRKRGARSENRLTDLTTRELEILSLIGDELSNKEIAARLCLSLHTVKNHVHSLLEKLSVRSRYAAVRYARESSGQNGVPKMHPAPFLGQPPPTPSSYGKRGPTPSVFG
jgi:DNA-binding NarL/FixJ family response regulator